MRCMNNLWFDTWYACSVLIHSCRIIEWMVSQDLFIYVNTVLSKSTFLFKLLALVPLIKLDHFMVKDAFFFHNQQTGRNHLFECIRLDTPFYCFKSAYCGEWLVNLDTLHKQTFFWKHTDTITILFLFSCS